MQTGTQHQTLREQTRRHRIPVDYDKDIVDICRDVLKFAVSTSYSLDMICRPWALPDESLSSWIAPVTRNAFGLGKNGVSCRINADPLVGQPGPGSSFYNAAKNTPSRVRFNKENKASLFAFGFVLGVIREKILPALAGVIPAEWNEAVDWRDTSKPPPDGFWRTLVGNRDSSGRRPMRLWKKACQQAFEEIWSSKRSSRTNRRRLSRNICNASCRRCGRGGWPLWKRRTAVAAASDGCVSHRGGRRRGTKCVSSMDAGFPCCCESTKTLQGQLLLTTTRRRTAEGIPLSRRESPTRSSGNATSTV
ncbi:hypothetical protein VTN77DRAFT_1307 [Rasamsonia byssochlamydoides]|uniref:uncharacterized protein n=1 Tax=Rasamsonia byssochlamydoides TaxID=89139 RepID=UPI003742EAF6